MQIDVRHAVGTDLPGVMALAPRLGEGIAPWRNVESAVRAAEHWLAESFATAAQGRGAVFVAVDGTRVVGVISVSEQRHFTGEVDAYVGELAVAPDVARAGVGRRLMAAAEQWARGRGLRYVTLQTGAGNAVAREFYTALGYREEEIRFTRRV